MINLVYDRIPIMNYLNSDFTEPENIRAQIEISFLAKIELFAGISMWQRGQEHGKTDI